ncbi:hypothetical protein EHI96_11125 [Cronobacter malonaticus]|uniref:hypothetical protein n=1 Tax=Cronobacter malonaticus TaxID=413503 RepID=UPI00137599A1|nr:hypothetical protein [Cronobacter malonaticus]NCI00397.1 hypothetical protein [Cronobacter malonaticus]
MKIEISSQNYILVLVYYPLCLIPPIFITYFTPYITNSKYVVFYFIMAKNNPKPYKRFLSRKKAEEFYSNLVKEDTNKIGHINSFVSVNLSLTVTTKIVNSEEVYNDLEFNGGKKRWESFDKEDQDYLKNLLTPLPNYISNTLENTKKRKDALLEAIDISNEVKLKFK